MNRYVVFAGSRYYPMGGWEDFVESYDDLDKAKAECVQEYRNQNFEACPDWLHIVDLQRDGATVHVDYDPS